MSEPEDEQKQPEDVSETADTDYEATSTGVQQVRRVECGPGPFKMQSLIEALPAELEYTCFDSYGQNLYLGTVTGDLLHYFEIELRNYMLVSQTRFDEDKCGQIDKLVLLPEIDRALVLSQGVLRPFLLPEFAPAPNTDSFARVHDVSLFSYSPKSQSYKLFAYAEEAIKCIEMSAASTMVSKTYDHTSIRRACIQGKVLMTANDSSYEIINLSTGLKVPLFRISEGEARLPPVIASFGTQEFLVTCGAAAEESSMALIVNHQGDITQGTIVLERYPTGVVVAFPYILVDFGNHGISVYRMETNVEPRVVQKISGGGSALRIARTTKTFGNPDPETRSQVVEKLRLVPLVAGNHEFRIEQETVYVEKAFGEETSLAMYGTAGIFLLSQRPGILDWGAYGEEVLDQAEDALRRMDAGEPAGKYKQMEKVYLKTLYLLLLTLHCTALDRSVAEKWCVSSAEVDIRLLLYIGGFQIYGELWIPNGLLNFVCELKKLKLLHKSEDCSSFLRYISGELKTTFRASLKDSENVLKSVDMVFLRMILDSGGKVDCDEFEECSLGDMVQMLKAERKDYSALIFQIYERQNDLGSCLSMLRDTDTPRLGQFIVEHYDQISKQNPQYCESELLDDIVLMLNSKRQTTKDEEQGEQGEQEEQEERHQAIQNAVQILKASGIDTKQLISRVSTSEVKVTILEKLGAADSQDREFLMEYYVAQLQKCMEACNLWNLFARFTTTYSQDLNYFKLEIAEYMDVKLQHSDACREFVRLRGKIISLARACGEGTLASDVFTRIDRFDIGSVLALLFLDDRERLEALGANKLLDTLVTLNDFVGIERCVTQANLSRVMAHYLSLAPGDGSLSLVHTLLRRNIPRVQDTAVLQQLLREIPASYELGALFDVVLPILKRIDRQRRAQEIKKALIKQEIGASNQMIKNLGVDTK